MKTTVHPSAFEHRSAPGSVRPDQAAVITDSIWPLGIVDAPAASPAVRDSLRRQSRRQDLETLIGSRLWVSRLGLSVLVHQRCSADAWACTAADADSTTGRLPAGVLLLSTVELSRALPVGTAPWTIEEFCAAWQVQVIDRGVPLDFTTALIEAVDPVDRSVDLRASGLVRRSGCRVASGLERRRQQLIDMGAVRPTASAWVELVLPGPVWTW